MVPLLDITRLMSRAGRTLTGVDRVELAYLDRFLQEDQAFGLARTSLGYLVLNRDGLARFRDRTTSGDWGKVDPISRWSRRLDQYQKAAVSSVRADAVARVRRAGLAGMVRGLGVSDYFNVGHSNLEPKVLHALGRAGLRRHVFIHDTIPLDHPSWQRPGTVQRYRQKFNAAIQGADRILCNSAVTAKDIIRHASGTVPPITVAHLGVPVVTPAKTNPIAPDTHQDLAGALPYFVTVGTIEPRKNHALLFDIWGAMQVYVGMPALHVCGPRGWNNADVFARLDTGFGGHVVEMPGLSDADLAALLKGSRGLLFPSFAEGFGLPPIEAAALGVPVVCGDLAIYRETLGDLPIYLDPTDPYQWTKVIEELTARPRTPKPFAPPTWEAHFKTVLSMA